MFFTSITFVVVDVLLLLNGLHLDDELGSFHLLGLVVVLDSADLVSNVVKLLIFVTDRGDG
jgi:hypothetical protein